MDKDAVRWALHWPKEEIPEDVLAKYPDLQEIDRQINLVADSINMQGNVAMLQGKSFDIRNFPMNDRVAQREFVRVSDLKLQGIEDVNYGKKNWEVFHASEIIVVGIQKRLKGVLHMRHNMYMDRDYRDLQDGENITYAGKKVQVAWHAGAHLMKYYRENDSLKPIFPSGFEYQVEFQF